MRRLTAESLPLLGVDFSSAPSVRKPITVARGSLTGDVLRLERIDALPHFAAFESMLRESGPWLGAFDFPFGLPREFVDSLALGSTLDAVCAEVHRRCGTRMGFRALVDAWGNGRPAGQRLVHRHTDRAHAGVSSTSPLQTRYVPVGFMYFEGLRRLVEADLTLPRLRQGDAQRVALEGYPGLLAFELIGRRSYKNSDASDRRAARADMLDALRAGGARQSLRVGLHVDMRVDMRVDMTTAQRRAILVNVSGDLIDALLCLVQAARASTRADLGLPADVDAVEGWIVGAGVC